MYLKDKKSYHEFVLSTILHYLKKKTRRNKMVKKRKALLSVLLCAALLAGCGSVKEESGQTDGDAEAKKSKVTLTFGTHQSGLPTSGVMQELADAFETETGIKVDFQITPDDQWRDLLKTKLDSGEAYDIMCVDADPLSLYSRINPEQNCVDLSDQEWVSRMDSIVIPDVSYGDKVYGIQFPGTRVSAYVYNKEIFKNLELEIPKTFEEFKAVCQTILDSGTTPVYEACQNGWHQVLPLFETGSYYTTLYDDLYQKLNENKMKVTEVKEIKLILEQMKECADLGFYGPDFMSQSVEGGIDALGTGQVGMMYQTTAWMEEVIAAHPDMKDKLGLFSPPWADNQSVSVNPTNNAYFINKNSKYIEECKAFFDFLARPENLQKRLDGGGITSVCWPEIKSKESEEAVAYINSLPQGTVMQVGVSYIDPQWMDVGKDIDAMYTGTMTPDEVFQNIEKRRVEQAKLQQDPNWK